MQIELSWLSLVIGGVLPLLVAIVTSRVASPKTKSIVLALLAAATGLLLEFQDSLLNNVSYDWASGIANALLVFLTAVTAHFEGWRRAGVTGADGAIQKKVPTGLGGSVDV